MRTAMLQRKGLAPDSVQRVLASPGRPLDPALRAQMESRFEHDFSGVRLHTDGAAARSARDVSARAWTVGNHIAFAPGAFRGDVLAHELTHTIQQEHGGADLATLAIGSSSSPAEAEADRVADRVMSGDTAGAIGAADTQIARAPEDEPPAAEGEQQQPPPPPQTGKVIKGAAHGQCGRKTNTRVAGFDNTTAGPHISAIAVDIKTAAQSPVALTWMNVPAGVTVPSQLNGSPGAGLCQMWNHKAKVMEDVDCSDVTWSNTTDSLCTPIGDFIVEGFRCQLPGEPKATRVTWFQHSRGIAFHNYDPVPAFPASHGCVRIDKGEADWIYDNSIPNVTTVSIKRAAGDPGPKCYKGKKLTDRAGYTPPQPPAGTQSQPTPSPTPEEQDGP